jgi:hypothetical protein
MKVASLYNSEQLCGHVSPVAREYTIMEETFSVQSVAGLVILQLVELSQTVTQLHQVLIGFIDLDKTCVGQSCFYRVHFT